MNDLSHQFHDDYVKQRQHVSHFTWPCLAKSVQPLRLCHWFNASPTSELTTIMITQILYIEPYGYSTWLVYWQVCSWNEECAWCRFYPFPLRPHVTDQNLASPSLSLGTRLSPIPPINTEVVPSSWTLQILLIKIVWLHELLNWLGLICIYLIYNLQ